MSNKVYEKKKMRFIKEEEKRDLIVYGQHLKHVYKIEKRESITYNFVLFLLCFTISKISVDFLPKM